MIKHIRIVDNPKYVIVTRHGQSYFLYYMMQLDTINRYCDIGVWKISYKKGLS